MADVNAEYSGNTEFTQSLAQNRMQEKNPTLVLKNGKTNLSTRSLFASIGRAS